MYSFSCPACLKQLFTVSSIFPCVVPKPLPDLNYDPARIVTSQQNLRLCKKIRCKCGYCIGDWILSSDGGDFGTWKMSGIWSENGKVGLIKDYNQDLCALGQKNLELKKSLKPRIERANFMLEGLATQLMDFILKYYFKVKGKEIAIPSPNWSTLTKLEFLIAILIKETEQLNLKRSDYAQGSKKSIKFN